MLERPVLCQFASMVRWSTALVVLVGGAVSAHADDTAPVRTLLADPAQLATWLRDRDPQTAAARAKVEVASAQREQARVLPNPQASLGVGNIVIGKTYAQPNMPVSSSIRDTSIISIGVSQLVEIGKRGPRRDAADLRAREAGEGLVGALGGRVNDAMTTLGKLAYVSAKHAVLGQNLDAARQLEAKEHNRLDRNDLAGADFERIELDTDEIEIQLRRADADVSAAIAACSATLFAPCSEVGLDVAALEAAAPLPPSLDDPERAIAQRPVHAQQRIEASALGFDATLAEHRKIPDPTVGLSYNYDNFAGDASPQTLAVSLSLPLPLFDRGNHDADAARANARAIAAQEQFLVRAERGQVEALLAQREKLQKVLDQLVKTEVPKSEQVVVQARKAFDIGQTGPAELLLAERQHRDLLLEVLDTRFDLFNVRVGLRQALGLDDQLARSAVAK